MKSEANFKKVDGNNILYHYIQKNLVSENDEFTKKLIEKLIIDLSIWLPLNLFKSIPILIPYAIRDASCRKSANNINEEWGSANSYGFLRDDNSLIKGIIKSHSVVSNKISQYNRKKLGKGFVASHIWREIEIDNKKTLASSSCKTYSFIPNLVWLPNQISKLTDREGSYAQRILQKISREIYFSPETNTEIKKIWNHLPDPDIDIEVETELLNYFRIPANWIEKRQSQTLKEIGLINETLNKRMIENDAKVKCSRYLPTLINIGEKQKEDLIKWLEFYKELISH